MQILSLIKIDKEYKLKDKKDRNLLLFLFFILFSTYPYVFYRIIPLPPVAILQFITLLFYTARKHLRDTIINRCFKSMIIIQAFATVMCMVVNMDLGYYKQLLYLFWVFIFLILINDFGIKRFLYYYNRILTIVAILGAFSTCLALFFGVRPLFEYTNMDGRPGWFVYFTFTNVQTLGIIRYSGIFDEAGAFAGWAMLALLTNRLFVKDKKIEYPLMIATLFTFSFGYIFQLIIYVLLFYIAEGKNSVKLAVIFIIFIGVALFNYYVPEDSPVYMLTVGRLGLDESENFFENNNRTEMIAIAKRIFVSNPFWGVGTTRFYSGEYAADNPYETLAKDGLIGTIFLYLPLLWVCIKTKLSKDILYAIFIALIGYAQRPFHINLQHYLMLYLLCYSCYKCFIEKNRINQTI